MSSYDRNILRSLIIEEINSVNDSLHPGVDIHEDIAATTILVSTLFEDRFLDEEFRIREFNKRIGLNESDFVDEDALREGLGADLFFGIGGALPFVGAPIAGVGVAYYINEWTKSSGTFDKALNGLMAVLSAFQVIGSLLAVGGVAVGAAKGFLIPLFAIAKGLGTAGRIGRLTKAEKLFVSALKPGTRGGRAADATIGRLAGMTANVEANFIRAGAGGMPRAAEIIAKTPGISAARAKDISLALGRQWSGSVGLADSSLKAIRSASRGGGALSIFTRGGRALGASLTRALTGTAAVRGALGSARAPVTLTMMIRGVPTQVLAKGVSAAGKSKGLIRYTVPGGASTGYRYAPISAFTDSGRILSGVQPGFATYLKAAGSAHKGTVRRGMLGGALAGLFVGGGDSELESASPEELEASWMEEIVPGAYEDLTGTE